MKKKMQNSSLKKKKIWIDLDNSPHVLFFRPIIQELKNNGFSLILTARDAFQVCELLEYFQLNAIIIGKHPGKNKVVKVIGLIIRALQLMPYIRREKPLLAISHGSRSQFILAKMLGITSVNILDYEHSRPFPLVYPEWVIQPEVIPVNSVKWARNVLTYPGIKEDVYIPKFTPDGSIVQKLGLKCNKVIITIRPPATEAHYHNPESEVLFEKVVDYLGKKENVQMIILPRTEKQALYIKKRWKKIYDDSGIVIPEMAVDGLNLIWHSDLIVSGGGTMNREAAALDIPVYSIFRGKIGAVDKFLEEEGKLILIESVNDIEKIDIKNRSLPKTSINNDINTLRCITEMIYRLSE